MELTKYELARIIGARALQLSQGAPPLAEALPRDSFIQVAEKELDGKALPLAVIRGATGEE